MLVAIDVGNTQTVIGLYAPVTGRPAAARNYSTTGGSPRWRLATADEMALLIDQLFQLQGPRSRRGHHRHRGGLGRAPACGRRCGR